MDHDAREASNAIMVALILPSYEALVKEHNDEPAELGLMLVNYACGGDNNNFHAAHKGFLGSIVEIPFLVATLKELLNILTSTGERLCEDEERDCPPESIDADELFR
jgi:hypothetical protein